MIANLTPLTICIGESVCVATGGRGLAYSRKRRKPVGGIIVHRGTGNLTIDMVECRSDLMLHPMLPEGEQGEVSSRLIRAAWPERATCLPVLTDESVAKTLVRLEPPARQTGELICATMLSSVFRKCQRLLRQSVMSAAAEERSRQHEANPERYPQTS